MKLARRTDRFTQLALVATKQAITNAELRLEDENRDRIGVIFGTGVGGIGALVTGSERYLNKGPKWVSPYMVPMMLPDTAPGQIAIEFGLRGPNMAIVTACASAANALGEAVENLKRGAADVVIEAEARLPLFPLP